MRRFLASVGLLTLTIAIAGGANLMAQDAAKAAPVGPKIVAGSSDKKAPPKADVQKLDSELITSVDTGDLKSVFVIACDSQPGKVIVLDGNGRWLPTVKTVEVKFDVGGPATIVCTMYEGAFKPTTPATKTWRLAQLKTVSNPEFQGMIDSLQTDPEAIKKSLGEKASNEE